MTSPITARGIDPDVLETPFSEDARLAAWDLLHRSPFALLSTLDSKSGYPYGSATNVVVDYFGRPVISVSWIAIHTRNLLEDPRISLTVFAPNGEDILASQRATFAGTVKPVSDDDLQLVRGRYVRKYPESKKYIRMPDQKMFYLETEGVQISAGPGLNANWSVEAREATPPFNIYANTSEDTLIETLEQSGIAERLGDAICRVGGESKIVAIDADGISLLTDKKYMHRGWYTEEIESLDNLSLLLQGKIAFKLGSVTATGVPG